MPLTPERKKSAIQALKSLQRQVDPEGYARGEQDEQSSRLEGIEQAVGSKEPSRAETFMDLLRGDQGKDGPMGPEGKPGKSPVRGIDYFTISDIRAMVNEVLRIGTPVKDVHYRDGKDSTVPGPQGPMGPQGLKGEPGRDGKDGKDASEIEVDALISNVISKIRKEKPLYLSDLRDGQSVKYNKKDQRWHGGGPTLVAGANITLTVDANGTTTVTSTGGSTLNPQVPTGTVDGVNTTFGFTGTISMVFVNGSLQTPTTDYSIVGQDIIFVFPPTGQLFAL